MATYNVYWRNNQTGNVEIAQNSSQARQYAMSGNYSATTSAAPQNTQLQGYITELQSAYNEALAANQERRTAAEGLYNQIIQEAQNFGTGLTEQLEATKKKDVASATQSLISSGLANTTRAATLGKKWEEDVGAKARTEIAGQKSEKLSQAYAQKAQFLTNIENEYPDYGTISNLILQSYA